ncbi:MAG: LptA/OstA family protein [Verrucomicrobiota bacterium]
MDRSPILPGVLQITRGIKPLLLGVGITGVAWAQLPEVDVEIPQIEADSQEFDEENNRIVAKGNIELSHGKIILKSDELEIETDESTLRAKNQVQLTREAFRILSDEAEYDYFKRSFLASDFRLGRHPIFLEGDVIEGDNDEIKVKDGTLYFQEPDPYAFNIRASSFSVQDSERLVVDDATFLIGDVPFFYLPHFEQDLKDDAPITYKGDGGFQNNLGGFIQNQVKVRLYPELRLGANLDGYSKRGFLGGPVGDYNWSWAPGGNFMVGSIDTGFIHDLGSTSDRGIDSLGQQIGRNRFFTEWRHLGEINGNIDLTSTLSWWSDSEITRDFRPELFYDNQVPDSFAQASYRGENYVGSVFLRYQPNEWELVAQRLPEVSYNVLPSELFETGIYQRLDTSFVLLTEKNPTGRFRAAESNRVNAYYGWSRPTKITDWMTATPVAGAMLTNYWQTYFRSGSFTRVLGEVGVDVELLATGVWDVKDEFWGIDGLRHVMRPVMQYRFIPAAQAGNTIIPPIDTRAAFQTYLDPIGLANKRNIDDLFAENTLRYGIENAFQTRAKGYGSYNLAEFNVYHELHFDERPDVFIVNPPYRPFFRRGQRFASDIFTEMTLRPAYWFASSIFIRIDPNSPGINEVNTRTRIVDGEEWSAYVGTNYVDDVPGATINQYIVGGDYRLNERNMLRTEFRIDADIGELVEQYYSWQTRFANSWDVEVQVGYLQGATREDGIQAKVKVRLLTF